MKKNKTHTQWGLRCLTKSSNFKPRSLLLYKHVIGSLQYLIKALTEGNIITTRWRLTHIVCLYKSDGKKAIYFTGNTKQKWYLNDHTSFVDLPQIIFQTQLCLEHNSNYCIYCHTDILHTDSTTKEKRVCDWREWFI